jgi:(2Fe-2S) ferredoxin
MPRPERHLFVCVNERPSAGGAGRPSCGARGGRELFAALQQAVGARPDLWGRVAVTGCSCLGPCFQGPTLVVYPDAVWYTAASAADAEAIVEQHLTANQPVERLRHRWPEDDEHEDGGDGGP